MRSPREAPVRPGTWEVELRSGDHVWVRPIEARDAAELHRAYAGLSSLTHFRHWPDPPVLSGALVHTLTQVDHVDREALIAVPSAGSARILGVARFARSPANRRLADLSIMVVDAWRGRGLATALLRTVSRRACAVGVRHFTVDTIIPNGPGQVLVKAVGGAQVHTTPGNLRAPSSLGDQPAIILCDSGAVLRAAARGEALSLPCDVHQRLPGPPQIITSLLLPPVATLALPDTACGV